MLILRGANEIACCGLIGDLISSTSFATAFGAGQLGATGPPSGKEAKCPPGACFSSPETETRLCLFESGVRSHSEHDLTVIDPE
jgi:hypothetical protein